MNRELGESAAASRRHPRARVDFPVALGLVDSENNNTIGRCVELSVGGMKVLVEGAEPRGKRLRVQLERVNRAPLDLDASIVWAQPKTDESSVVGLEFADMATAESSLGPVIAGLRAQHSWGAGL